MGKSILIVALLCAINTSCCAGLTSAIMVANASGEARMAEENSRKRAAAITTNICESNSYLIEELQVYRNTNNEIAKKLIGGYCYIWDFSGQSVQGVINDIQIGTDGVVLVTVNKKMYLTHIKNMSASAKTKETIAKNLEDGIQENENNTQVKDSNGWITVEDKGGNQ